MSMRAMPLAVAAFAAVFSSDVSALKLSLTSVAKRGAVQDLVAAFGAVEKSVPQKTVQSTKKPEMLLSTEAELKDKFPNLVYNPDWKYSYDPITYTLWVKKSAEATWRRATSDDTGDDADAVTKRIEHLMNERDDELEKAKNWAWKLNADGTRTMERSQAYKNAVSAFEEFVEQRTYDANHGTGSYYLDAKADRAKLYRRAAAIEKKLSASEKALEDKKPKHHQGGMVAKRRALFEKFGQVQNQTEAETKELNGESETLK